MPIDLTLAELLAARGRVLEPSDWLEITQERINDFARATNDEQWIHVDPVLAQAGPFGRTIAHGYLTLSLLPYLVQQVVTVSDVGLLVNYGLDRLRYPAPVPVGSRVRLTGQIADAEEKLGGVLFRVAAQVEVEGQSKPGLVAELLYLALPRPTA